MNHRERAMCILGIADTYDTEDGIKAIVDILVNIERETLERAAEICRGASLRDSTFGGSQTRPAYQLTPDLAVLLKATLRRIASNPTETSSGGRNLDNWVRWAKETARNAEAMLESARVAAVSSDVGEENKDGR